MKCPYCSGNVLLKDSSIIYGKSYGLVYICENYPKCSAFVGVHQGTTRPLGTLADSRLRELRKQCHAKFDQLWKSKKMARYQAYIWLQDNMEMTPEQAHIGMFRENDCIKLLDKLK
jgi:ssDNA-binding Zn-finger/Zn-ribbon topoisomerase 1